MDIHSLIGGATACDKKQMLEVRHPENWLKSVSAFANGEGGALIFGIGNDNHVALWNLNFEDRVIGGMDEKYGF